jgi:phage gpG-like protein
MISFKQFAAKMERSAGESLMEIEAGVLAVTVATAAAAKDLVGRENPEWPPLSPYTISEKTLHGYVGRISATDPLYRTGEMRDSIEGVSEGLTGVVGSADKVALWQEMGTLRPTGSVPPRPFLGLAMSRIYPLADRVFGLIGVNLVSVEKIK